MFVRNLFCFIYLLISANVLLAFEKATYLPVYGKYDVLTNSLAENKFSIYYLSFLRVREDGSIYVDWGDDRASSHLKNFFSRDERCRWVVGGEKGSAYLSDVLSDTDSEKRLLKQLIQYVVDYNCEGVDIDWEFPSLNNGLVDPERMHDRVNFVHFACQLKEGLIQARRKAALSLSIPGNGGGIMLTGFDLLGLNQCVDYFNIMSYDRPTGDSFGRFHSAFYPDGNDAQSYNCPRVIGAGILTCFPSATHLCLALGADSPYADERCVGNLALTASGLFTRFNATHVSIRTSDTSSSLYKPPSQAYRTLSYHAQ